MNTHRFLRTALALSLCLALCLCLTGCFGRPSAQEAETYVTTLMSGLCGTLPADTADESAAEAEALRTQLIDEVIAGFRGQGAALDEETEALIRSTLTSALAACRFTVGDAVKSGGGYDVPVTVSPLKLFQVDMAAVEEEAIRQLSQDPDLLTMSQSQVSNKVFRIMLAMIADNLDNPQYGEDVTATVRYERQDDGEYGISQDSGAAIGRVLFDLTQD